MTTKQKKRERISRGLEALRPAMPATVALLQAGLSLPRFKCSHCRHVWTIRKAAEPKTCPKCNRVTGIQRVA